MVHGIELVTAEDGRIVRLGIVLNPLTDKQRVIPRDSAFIDECLKLVPRGPLPVYTNDLVADGKIVSVEDYCVRKDMDPLDFLRNYKVGGTEPRFVDSPRLVEHASPGDRNYNLAVAQHFSGINVNGVNVYSCLVF